MCDYLSEMALDWKDTVGGKMINKSLDQVDNMWWFWMAEVLTQWMVSSKGQLNIERP